MHRAYTADRYREVVQQMRDACPDVAITTDIIVGFPGETEADYQETRKLVQEIQFDNAFIFRYSERKDTPAAIMDEQLSDEIKMERNKDLLAVIDDIVESKSTHMLGQTVEVLVEGPSKNNKKRLSGRTRQNKIVILEGPDRLIGQLIEVKIEESTGFTFYGDPVIHTS